MSRLNGYIFIILHATQVISSLLLNHSNKLSDKLSKKLLCTCQLFSPNYAQIFRKFLQILKKQSSLCNFKKKWKSISIRSIRKIYFQKKQPKLWDNTHSAKLKTPSQHFQQDMLSEQGHSFSSWSIIHWMKLNYLGHAARKL